MGCHQFPLPILYDLTTINYKVGILQFLTFCVKLWALHFVLHEIQKAQNFIYCNWNASDKLCFTFLDQITKKYLGFFIPEEGDALAMAHAFYDFLKKNGLEKILQALSLDGKNMITHIYMAVRTFEIEFIFMS